MPRTVAPIQPIQGQHAPGGERADLRAGLQAPPERAVIPAWVLLPLRLFLGVTFVYAGLQKLTDPHYFRQGTPTSIGTQIAAFAHGTPLQGFLLHVALPHAILFGALVAYGELAIGLGTVVGLLMRPAAVFGLLLSLTFFLSASWRVTPYFYGADIVFVFGWITLLLTGPAAGGVWPALDARLAARALAALNPTRRATVARVVAIVLGVSTEADRSVMPPAHSAAAPSSPTQQSVRRAKGSAVVGQRFRGRGGATTTLARRQLLRGVALGGGGMLVLVWLRSALFPSPSPAAPTPTQSAAGSTQVATTSSAPASSATSTAAASSNVIGQVSQITPNSAVSFTIPSNQDAGVLVRTQAGKFVAFDATCTHAGCPVQYDPSSQLLICPCHGAEFDPAHNAAVVQGPTDTPLTGVPISVNTTTGAISLNS